eukprot:NODE_1199_length_1053_cov_117.462151_g930_i0.p1 GENE.NODE_1199_length_1053_cov_117.462151_g930_i0~~NODE_1199_length_1053_cov_117.462151_g930_i0.p1  ORF type:complete len:288 (+),score=84.73 NODE_1199_length_1053_cov_117.462151_g930_i0:62-865(+)
MQLRWLVLLFAISASGLELVMEVSFDLALKTETETGFKPTDALQVYLTSDKMKWLRSWHMLVSGQITKPQRVALLAFKNHRNWAEFEEENLVKTHALFDHFWLNSKRVLWNQVSEDFDYPSRTRSMEKPGGFMWVFKYSVIAEKEASWEKFYQSHMTKLAAEVQTNDQFVEASAYSTRKFQRMFQHMVMWEFLSMSGLSEAVYESKVMAEFIEAVPQYCSDWNSVVLVPPTDEDGKQVGFFYPAAGADPSEEDKEKTPQEEAEKREL